MGAFRCEVTWFCCGDAWGPCEATGHGACGTCNSGNMQHAWPNASDACWDITRPDLCGRSVNRRTCGFKHKTTNLCSGSSVITAIADCGPRTKSFCGEEACCGSTCAKDRLIDLTAGAYSKIASLSTGKRPAEVDVA